MISALSGGATAAAESARESAQAPPNNLPIRIFDTFHLPVLGHLGASRPAPVREGRALRTVNVASNRKKSGRYDAPFQIRLSAVDPMISIPIWCDDGVNNRRGIAGRSSSQPLRGYERRLRLLSERSHGTGRPKSQEGEGLGQAPLGLVTEVGPRGPFGIARYLQKETIRSAIVAASSSDPTASLCCNKR